jgi:hypothetical protein
MSPLPGAASLLPSIGYALRVTADVLLSLRHAVRQRPAMQALLREANACEASDPVQSAALRNAAARLLA